MASTRLPISTTNLPSISEPEASTTDSPARGRAMVAALHRKLRPTYPLVHSWTFWHDRQDRKRSPEPSTNATSTTTTTPSITTSNDVDEGDKKYEDRLVELLELSDVKHFWELFNNFNLKSLPLRDSVHLFKKGVKPLWEDERNVRGGAWTFRVPKEQAAEFWKHVCLLAIGENLQEAVAMDRTAFKDDICGASYSVRFTSILITIWNRDADHEDGIKRILDTVLEQVPEEIVPKPSAYYYKKHSDHAGFSAGGAKKSVADELAKTQGRAE
ncbi:translation initiation factor eIF4e [Tothia fuscella]|uniref:Translation initiation factor eIF4e n=1 Tax=Tothia fuscella TaxID=1048955 RepID=A0A9P4NX57_9PEZI|nr:translation initiation factor eIF4e [Tothia fuscella]